jgi:hypothetical protein
VIIIIKYFKIGSKFEKDKSFIYKFRKNNESPDSKVPFFKIPDRCTVMDFKLKSTIYVILSKIVKKIYVKWRKMALLLKFKQYSN